jgi:hypothetical protein
VSPASLGLLLKTVGVRCADEKVVAEAKLFFNGLDEAIARRKAADDAYEKSMIERVVGESSDNGLAMLFTFGLLLEDPFRPSG